MSAIWMALLAVTVLAEQKICPHVINHGSSIRLTANERVLVCGSDEQVDAWKSVSPAQAERRLEPMMQARGYYKPRFEVRGNELHVWPGSETFVREFKADNIDIGRRRHVVGHPLTSSLLDELQSWGETELRSSGHACPKVMISARTWDQSIRLSAEPGPRTQVRSIEWRGYQNLDPRVLDRYRAFDPGSLYDVRQTQITVNRMLADGLFETASFQTKCEGSDVDLTLETLQDRPRLLRFGFGASTEELPFADVSYKNARLDRRASSFSALAHASPRLQSLSMQTEWFVLSPHVFIGPRYQLKRESEREYEVLSSRVGVDLGRAADVMNSRWLLRGGPSLNHVNEVEGLRASQTSYLGWEASLQGASHPYELFVRDQFEGWTGRFEYRGQRDRLGSNLNVDRYDFSAKKLWNVGAWSPPLFILASRVQLSAIDSKAGVLPIEYRLFWGGDQNIRGFARRSLNNRELGYLTGAYAGFEFRLVEELPYKFQPFLLYDVARLGLRRWTLDEPVFISYGGGMRWASPIGTLRASAAKGEISNGDASTVAYVPEWVYFFSFGQEF